MSENLSPIEELLTALNSQTVKIIQSEMQKVRRRILDMPTESWREQRFNLVANVAKDLFFNDTKPNYVIVTNYSEYDVYVGSSVNIGTANYDFIVPANSRIQWVWGRGLDHLYVFAGNVANVLVQTYESDFDPAAVSQTKLVADAGTVGLVGAVSVNNSAANPVPVSINGSLTKLSTEPFPTTGLENGYTCLNVDTKQIYVYYTGSWWLQ